jgi:hypothetical protein
MAIGFEREIGATCKRRETADDCDEHPPPGRGIGTVHAAQDKERTGELRAAYVEDGVRPVAALELDE